MCVVRFGNVVWAGGKEKEIMMKLTSRGVMTKLDSTRKKEGKT